MSAQNKIFDLARQCILALLTLPLTIRVYAILTRGIYRLTHLHASTKDTKAEHIVIIKLDHIGDMILTSPLLRELRRSFPSARITLIAASNLRDLLTECPYVSDSLFLNDPEAKSWRQIVRRWRDNTTLAWRHLLPYHITHLLLPRYGVDHYASYHLLALSGADQRIGFTINTDRIKAASNHGMDSLLTQVLPPAHSKHEVERILLLLRALGHEPKTAQLEVWPSNLARQRVSDKICSLNGKLLIGICPTSRELIKDWPFEAFLRLFRRFSEKTHITFLIFGGKEFNWLNEQINLARIPNVISYVGQIPLDESVELIGECHLFVTVDTGLMHIAAARKVPIVEITSAPEDGDPENHYSPARFGPWQTRHRVVYPRNKSSGESQRLIESVSVDQVAAAMIELLPALA